MNSSPTLWKHSLLTALAVWMIPPPSAHSEGGFEVGMNVGTSGYFEIGTPVTTGGVHVGIEAAGWDEARFSSGARHFVIGDFRMISALVFGRGTNEETGAAVNLFALRIEGNAAFGLQAYKVIPLNLSLEDGTYIKTNLDSRGTALLGTTVYLPIEFDRLPMGDKPVLFLALTAGARWNTEIHDAAVFGLQPKVRYLSDNFSAELRYLISLGTPEAEKKIATYFALKSLFRRGDEIGVSFSTTWSNLPENGPYRGTEVFVFYGINQ